MKNSDSRKPEQDLDYSIQGSDLNHFLPEKWSDWKLEEVIGGRDPVTVYKAIRTDEAGISYSAIKVLRIPEGGNKAKHIEEIKTMLSLKGHPNIVSIEDYATVSQKGYDYIFIRMELLTPLDRFVAANDFDETETIRVGIEICNALEHCQRKNILHLDIKPSNIFVTDEGHYKLGDFGISRSIDDLSTRPLNEFTPNFMGPELYQFLKEKGVSKSNPITSDILGSKYDQYALGLVLYWIRNNRRPPFLPERIVTTQDRKDAFKRRMDGEQLPQLKDTSSALTKIIFKASSYNPKDRYNSPTEMKRALEKLQNSTNIHPTLNIKSVIGILLAFVCVVLLIVYFTSRNKDQGGTVVSPSPSPSSLPSSTHNIESADAYGSCGENLQWILYGSELHICGTGGMYDYNSTTNQSPWSEYQGRISKIVVEEGVTKIGEYAFFKSEELIEVELPHSLRRINHMAFGYCYKLPLLIIPEGVEHIEKSIIYRCPMLTKIELPGSIKLIEGSFAGECENLTTITLGNDCTTYVLQNGVLFDYEMEELICHPAGLDDLSYSIPEKVRVVGVYAFAENKNLLEISIPEGLVTIDSCAFTGCVNLKSINLPNSISTLGIYAFYGCEKLKSIQLPPNIEWIDQQAFYNCYSLQEIVVPSKVTRIGTAVFSNCTSLKKIVIPTSVTSITNSAFDGSPNVVIYGENGSFAETFANEHNIPFIPNDEQQSLVQPAPFPGEYPVGLDISIDAFTSRSSQLINAAETWTEKTVPHTLDEFPLMPNTVFEVYNSINQCYSGLSSDGQSYVWKTNIPELLVYNKPDRYDISMQYIANDQYQYLPPVQLSTNSFSFTLPQNISIAEVEGISYDCYWDLPNGWTEILQISYEMKHGKMTGDLFVGIIFSRDDDCSIDWYPGFSVFDRYNTEIISIDIGTISGYEVKRIWSIDYNTKTGKIIRMSNSDQVIEINE